MELFWVVLSVCAVSVTKTLAQIQYCDLYPPVVQKCFKESHRHPVPIMDAHFACIKQFYVNAIPDLNITKADRDFFTHRAKTRFGLVPPPSGPRIRKEYRRLSKDERVRLHAALNILYKEGVIQRFGRLHASAAVSETIHNGAAFLAWHRVFITDFEEELRRVDPKVSLAYWDQTMDVNMTKPSDSVLWTPCFFGNGNGTITEGPFRGWFGGRNGPIQRDFARGECDTGRLINKKDLLNVLSQCRLQDISKPPDGLPFNLESLHDGTHQYVGGDMESLTLSAFEPIFYFHHAFIDYVWELFRRNQALRCGVNPETDYPIDKKTKPGHRAFDRMYGYEHLRNVDGLSAIFIKKFYQYEALPTCPDCGSPYLVCDFKRQMCVSRDKSACDMPRNAQGQHTYTGQGVDTSNIGFNGPMESVFTPFPKDKSFHSFLPADRRSRDMTYAESMRISIEQEGGNLFSTKELPFSPSMQLFPSKTGSFGGMTKFGSWPPSPFSSLHSPLNWSHKSKWLSPKLGKPFSSTMGYTGVARIGQHHAPPMKGFYPFKYSKTGAPQPNLFGYGASAFEGPRSYTGPKHGFHPPLLSRGGTHGYGGFGPPPHRPDHHPPPPGLMEIGTYSIKRTAPGYY